MSTSTTNNLPLNQDPASKYYIHPSDSNVQQLVSFKFGGTWFNDWKRSMLITLSAKNKIGLVNGSFVEPDAEKDPLEHQAWERCNDLVISWILFNLEPKVAKSVLHIRSARSMWVDLGDRFGYASLTLIYELEQKLANLSQGPMTVIDFFTAIKTVWDELNDADPTPTCTCNKCVCDLSKRVLDRELRQRMLRFKDEGRPCSLICDMFFIISERQC